MDVYKIEIDCSYQQLVVEGHEASFMSDLCFDASPKANNWNKPRFRVYDPTLKRGDFVGIAPGALGVSYDIDNDVLSGCERSGELLEIGPPELRIYCLNVTECANCLDHSTTEWVYGEQTKKPIRISKFSFLPQLIPESPIFKIPELRKGSLFTCTGMKDEDDEFMHQVEKLKLNGLKFKKVWSDNKKSRNYHESR